MKDSILENVKSAENEIKDQQANDQRTAVPEETHHKVNHAYHNVEEEAQDDDYDDHCGGDPDP